MIYYTPDEMSADGTSRKIAEYSASSTGTSTLSGVTSPETLLNITSDNGLNTITVSDNSVEPVSYTFGGVKTYLYDDADEDADRSAATMTEGQFTFVSESISWPGSDEADTTYRFDSTNVDAPGKRTATNGTDGTFSFDTYEFTTAGTWVFQITEQDDSATYDYIEYNANANVYTVTVVGEQLESTDTIYTITSVTVNDGSRDVYTYDADTPDAVTTVDMDSNETITALTTSANGSGIGFTNIYTAEAELDLVGTKNYGLSMTNGQFTFEAAEAKKDSDI
ncbi:MAG: hypothetical protein LUG64_05685 [Clostridiales bacterium]|nr:hypothetical protein [Clostridiales bacterium]